MGSHVTPSPGTYVAEQDLQIRAQPKNDGKRVGMIAKGDVITVLGKAVGSSWLAVTRQGKPYGFAYGPKLTPILDGAIDNDVTGEINVAIGHRCGYRISFLGRSEVEGRLSRVSDYEAIVVCERNGKRLRFPAQMFMTEAPIDPKGRKRIFQINVDLLDGMHGLDDIFSTSMHYDQDGGQVRFDQVSEETYGRKMPTIPFLPATSVPKAIGSAMDIALSTWSDKAWNDIFAHAR